MRKLSTLGRQFWESQALRLADSSSLPQTVWATGDHMEPYRVCCNGYDLSAKMPAARSLFSILPSRYLEPRPEPVRMPGFEK